MIFVHFHFNQNNKNDRFFYKKSDAFAPLQNKNHKAEITALEIFVSKI